MFLKEKFYKTPSTRISIRYCIISVILLIGVSFILPNILNYGPDSINTSFDIKMSYISYAQQWLLISLVTLVSLTIITKALLHNIDKWYKLDDSEKYKDPKKIIQIRKKCFNLPYTIFVFELLIPIVLTVIFLLLTGSHQPIMIIKILIIIISFLLLLSVCSYIFAKDIYSEILAKTYSSNLDIGFRIPLNRKIFIQILPIFISAILMTSLVGYSRVLKEKEDTLFNVYHKSLLEAFDLNNDYSYEEIVSILSTVESFTNLKSKFIILPNGSTEIIYGTEISDFVRQYTIEISEKYDGKTYDSYGIDTQGSTLKLTTSSGIFYVGLLYDIYSIYTLISFIICFIIILIFAIWILSLYGNSLSNELNNILESFISIYRNSTLKNKLLPVTSNDEIGDLIIAFNKIQDMTNKNIKQIKSNQTTLMEKERLASLGQMIGGISHNLKTPIMSISGAAEGLNDLIKEYNTSIEDPEVTPEDHHAIANDMQNWINKIHNYTSYMSDIITAVKGQAVALSETELGEFTIEELLKRVNILMKHELQNASVQLNTSITLPQTTTLHGDVNSLVQVINNLITNAIQSYNGKPDQIIDLTAKKSNNNIVLSVTDYGSGMPKEVQEKLFKSMITTKGKNGTGLGMFMSYSTVKGNFNGDITFKTEINKGTTFNVTLPINFNPKNKNNSNIIK